MIGSIAGGGLSCTTELGTNTGILGRFRFFGGGGGGTGGGLRPSTLSRRDCFGGGGGTGSGSGGAFGSGSYAQYCSGFLVTFKIARGTPRNIGSPSSSNCGGNGRELLGPPVNDTAIGTIDDDDDDETGAADEELDAAALPDTSALPDTLALPDLTDGGGDMVAWLEGGGADGFLVACGAFAIGTGLLRMTLLGAEVALVADVAVAAVAAFFSARRGDGRPFAGDRC